MSPIKHGCDCGKHDCVSYPECLYTYNVDDWDNDGNCPHYKIKEVEKTQKRRKSNLMTSYKADITKKIVIVVNNCGECDFCDHDFHPETKKGINHRCNYLDFPKELDKNLCFGGIPEWCPLEDE